MAIWPIVQSMVGSFCVYSRVRYHVVLCCIILYRFRASKDEKGRRQGKYYLVSVPELFLNGRHSLSHVHDEFLLKLGDRRADPAG